MRKSLIGKLGVKSYKIGFAVSVVLSIVLMVYGWRAGNQTIVYQPLEWARPIAMLFVLAGFLLFGFARAKTNVKRLLRHPQLAGLVAWATGHLLANGDSLSVVLFSGLGVWALVQMSLLNKRDGQWVKPDSVPFSAIYRPVAISLVIFAVIFGAHPYLFGVSPISG